MLGLGLHKGIGKSSGGDPNLLFANAFTDLSFNNGVAPTGYSVETPQGANIPTGLTSCVELAPDHANWSYTLKDSHIPEMYTTMYFNPVSIIENPLTFRTSIFEFGPFGGTDLWEVNYNGANHPTLDFEGPFDAGARSLQTINSGGLNRWYKIEIYHKMTASENILDIWVDGVNQNMTTNSPNEGPNLRSRRFTLVSQTTSQFGVSWQMAGLTMHRKKFVDIINP